MLMVIDIGNTNITLGIYQENMLKCTFRLMTKTPRTSDEYGATICSFLFASQIKTDEIEDVIIAHLSFLKLCTPLPTVSENISTMNL